MGELAKVPGVAPGLMSAGLGDVPAAQTYLDVSQGNRVFDSLYDEPLPRGVGGGICGPGYSEAVVERAESAPADIVPGLLARTLAEHGQRCAVVRVGLGGLRRLVGGLRGDGMAIAFARPPPAEDRALAVGIAGRGFGGSLTSDSTRTDGYVLSTDIAPTILTRLGIAVPPEMSGEPIRSEGAVDVGELESLGERMAVISARRGPVVGVSLLAWIVVFGLAALVGAARVGRVAVRLLCLSVVLMPLLLLAGAALRPAQESEQVLVMFGTPLLAALALAALGGLRALAVSSGLVVAAYALDVILGSPLTSLSLLGPNPGLGVRFYGIGNELEALLAVLVVAGTGAALAAFAPRLSARRCAAAFLLAGVGCALIFGAGRFGADVGAAIVLPVGAGVAAAMRTGHLRQGERRTTPLLIVAPIAILGLVALIDLASGANAHLTRSVLDAGGLDSLADVAQRRLRLSAHSFVRPVVFAFLPLVAALAALAWIRRARLSSRLEDLPSMGAGLLGALVAVVVGTLVNDSGALLLEIGAAYLIAFLAFIWAGRDERTHPT